MGKLHSMGSSFELGEGGVPRRLWCGWGAFCHPWLSGQIIWWFFPHDLARIIMKRLDETWVLTISYEAVWSSRACFWTQMAQIPLFESLANSFSCRSHVTVSFHKLFTYWPTGLAESSLLWKWLIPQVIPSSASRMFPASKQWQRERRFLWTSCSQATTRCDGALFIFSLQISPDTDVMEWAGFRKI